MRVLQGFLLSVLIHLILLLLMREMPLQAPIAPNEKISVEILEPKSQNETLRQIVREAEAPEKEKLKETTEDKLAFLSAQAQRVKQQTRALLNGMTKNRAQNEKSKPQKEKEEHKEFEAFAPSYRKTPKLKPIDIENGLSSIGESLPKEITIGSFTALNTDRYLFYSFYARIEELIRFRWESAVRNAIDNTPPDRFQTNASGLWTTSIEIWLKANGEYHSAHLMKESGFRSFDQSVIQAFMQARVFPNPPKEMVNSDGLIILKYNFQVHYEPKVLGRRTE